MTRLFEVLDDGTIVVRQVTRIANTQQRGDIVVTLTPDGIVFRYPRKRTRYLLPFGLGMHRAEELAAAQLRAEREARRKSKRAASGAPVRRVKRSLTRGR